MIHALTANCISSTLEQRGDVNKFEHNYAENRYNLNNLYYITTYLLPLRLNRQRATISPLLSLLIQESPVIVLTFGFSRGLIHKLAMSASTAVATLP